MHGPSNEMVDEEKLKGLKELLKLMYKKMSDSEDVPYAGKETPEEESMEEALEPIMGGEQHAGEEEEGEEGEGEGGEMDEDERVNFMKNRTKPRPSKGLSIMMASISKAKPMKKGRI